VRFVFDLRFPGQQYDCDSATGFNYNYFRDYDTIGGRYVQSDPIGLDGGISTYGYAGGMPTIATDPDGLFWGIAFRLIARNTARQGARASSRALSTARANPQMAGLTAAAAAGTTYYGNRLANDLSAIAGTVHWAESVGSGEGASCPPTADTAGTPPGGPDWDDEDNKAGQNFNRDLQASDLGAQGHIREIRGNFSYNNGVATMRIEMIRGEISNPLQIVKNMANTARSYGATTLRIEGTIANQRLYNILQGRYGLTSNGATDSIIIRLR
jgi:RHS repeat-associated protein